MGRAKVAKMSGGKACHQRWIDAPNCLKGKEGERTPSFVKKRSVRGAGEERGSSPTSSESSTYLCYRICGHQRKEGRL